MPDATNILISGAGIAGPALACWLDRYGFAPTLVERAPALRKGGYVVDFWGVGYDVAERMGLTQRLHDIGYRIAEVRLVNARGRKIGGFSADVFARLAADRFVSLPRGDLSAVIYDALGGRIETRFDDSISALDPHKDGVRVCFESGGEGDYNLIIGADGLHSNVRRLAFGPEEKFERFLGYNVAAFTIDGYRPRDELVYVSYTRPGMQAARFALRGDKTLAFFIFREERAGAPPGDDPAAQQAMLRAAFAGAGWECERLLEAMAAADDFYFDRVSQIRMGCWTKGRVALIGDAAACVSLLAGEGSGLALCEAYVLAGELARAKGDYRAAFAEYQRKLGPFLADKQKAAAAFASSFAPKTALGVALRNFVTNMMGVPMIADLALGRSLKDAFALPAYAEAATPS